MATLRKPSERTRSCRAWRFRIPEQTREARASWSPARCCLEARAAPRQCFARGTRRPVLSSRRFSCRDRLRDSPSRTPRPDGSTSPWRCASTEPWRSWLSHFQPRRHRAAAAAAAATEGRVSIIAFTDGAAKGNPGPGGWGAIVVTPDRHVTELGGGAPYTTNNKMELTGAIDALEHVAGQPGPV